MIASQTIGRSMELRTVEVPPRHWRWSSPEPFQGRMSDDAVELTDQARLMHALTKLPPGRLAIVERVRQAIAEGRYESDAKLEVAIDRIATDLTQEGFEQRVAADCD
jgi:anti-sigma28 factor (negative regulator of flagellin synthesis)